MTREDKGAYFDRAPLAVCVSDCQIDCGQPAAELMKLCFQVNCAFAEMRWHSPIPLRVKAANSKTQTVAEPSQQLANAPGSDAPAKTVLANSPLERLTLTMLASI